MNIATALFLSYRCYPYIKYTLRPLLSCLLEKVHCESSYWVDALLEGVNVDTSRERTQPHAHIDSLGLTDV